MATSLQTKRGSLPRLKDLLSLTRFAHSEADSSLLAPVKPQMRPGSTVHQSKYDKSKWKKLDARQYGISLSMIPPHPWDVLKILRGEGYDAYLVGGCVRDLVLNRIPKDFDVITTAKLDQIKKIFHRAMIVGRRFPICRVLIKGSVVEVSSFETRSQDAIEKKVDVLSVKPGVSAKRDFLLWRDAMSRDFTINSLFLDPCGSRKIIYDYTNAMADLKSLKLQTLIPAKLSFTEDCARILRGLRIAARLGLALSKETEDAVHSLGPSITDLPKDRILMEMDYMLSYGAAEPSLHLLWSFGLVKLLLPPHSAYLDQQHNSPSFRGTLMLMRLFANLDKLVSCDRPSNSRVWVALLGFHLAVMKNPQDALVIWAFAYTLYEGKWKLGVSSARKHAVYQVDFSPEISGSSHYTSQELAENVSHLASLVTESVASLCYSDDQQSSSCSGMAFISKRVGSDTREIFRVLEDDVESYNINRAVKKIDYVALRKGHLRESRFVVGKVILETMKGGIVREGQDEEVIDDDDLAEEEDEMYDLVERKEHPMGDKEDDHSSPLSVLVAKAEHKCNSIEEQETIITKRRRVVEIEECNEKVENKYQEERVAKNKEDDHNSPLSVLVAKAEHRCNNLEEQETIITKRRRVVEIEECNEKVENKYQEEKVAKKSKPSQQVEEKKESEQAIAKEQQKPKPKPFAVKNKAHLLSRLFRR